ncbi:MAG: class I SAM-dependent methyltransferase [Acidobacteria bacterium]|nr:class I SAM-dependent methyltransferase [Acidobacteriota bacterium]
MAAAPDAKGEELRAMIEALRERVRARYPSHAGGAANLPLADLLPVVHARDAAEGKVAAIGTVNPREPGLLNGLIQGVKKLVARLLDWHVREQIEFNRAALGCVESLLDALGDVNRSLAALAADSAARHEELRAQLEEARAEARELRDIRSHWAAWRAEWERKLSVNEVQFLRSVADLQTAFQHRVSLIEANFRDIVRSQHRDFTTALDRATLDIQQRLWADLERIRAEYERLIHEELRVVRQRMAAVQPAPSLAAPAAPAAESWDIDWLRFAARFRGSEKRVRELARFYVPHFAGATSVLDLGCGRGEFLEVMREAGIAARGVDLSAESVALCRAKGLGVERSDLFEHLAALADASLDGIFCGQVVEHLPPPRLPELVRLAAAKLARGGVLAIETPNPECLAIFATHFFLDPTHARPIPSSLLVFYAEECGFGRIEVHRLSPAAESMSSLAGLPEDFRQAFFDGLDYAVTARRL